MPLDLRVMSSTEPMDCVSAVVFTQNGISGPAQGWLTTR